LLKAISRRAEPLVILQAAKTQLKFLLHSRSMPAPVRCRRADASLEPGIAEKIAKVTAACVSMPLPHLIGALLELAGSPPW
jgi:hypothetical protein